MCTGWYSAISQAYNKDHLFLMMQRHTDRNWTSVNYSTSGETETSKCLAQISKLLCSSRKKPTHDAHNTPWCFVHLLLLYKGRPAGGAAERWRQMVSPVGSTDCSVCCLFICRILLCLIITTVYKLSSVTNRLSAFIPAWHLLQLIPNRPAQLRCEVTKAWRLWGFSNAILS